MYNDKSQAFLISVRVRGTPEIQCVYKRLHEAPNGWEFKTTSS